MTHHRPHRRPDDDDDEADLEQRKNGRSVLEKVLGSPKEVVLAVLLLSQGMGWVKAHQDDERHADQTAASWTVLGQFNSVIDTLKAVDHARDSILIRHGIDIRDLKRRVYARGYRRMRQEPETLPLIVMGPPAPPRSGTLLESLRGLLPWNWGKRR